MKKILLLGSGELGKEFIIACQRLGQHTIAIDSYQNAPAMQVADESEVIDMLNGDELDRIVAKYQPDIIVPEIEAIRTEKFFEYEEKDIQVVPSANAANYTMNRKSIRDLAAKKLGIKTADYRYAKTSQEFKEAIAEIGLPCVVKPLMSSSGKGQTYVKKETEIDQAWQYALDGSRGDLAEVIIEEFIDFKYEITLLTVTQNSGPTLFCSPIGHRQERGDYQESWQPMHMKPELLKEAQSMADKVTDSLGGAGLWGVEFFIGEQDVWFSELSPRPHDTGMVTLANTQNLNEFELHARAVLHLPIPEIKLLQTGASAVILSDKDLDKYRVSGIEQALLIENTDIRMFAKPSTRKYRRMGVALASADLNQSTEVVRGLAKQAASKVTLK
ncbi:UNVERIFIED_CONTAM: hypothetical protein GTU68_013247 [Idotea baltica]|nr:hypothetical protein [Idotea baltica]